MYSASCRLLCWMLIFAQVGACKKKAAASVDPSPAAQPAAPDTPASDFCAQTKTPLALATVPPKVQWASKGDGTNAITFTLDNDYDESFFTWNICPDRLQLGTFNHFAGKPFAPSCQMAQNQTSTAHTFDTNLLTVPHAFFYFMACNQDGICQNQVKVEVTNLPGPHVPTAAEIQAQQQNYDYYLGLATTIHSELEKIYKNATPAPMQALYGTLLALSLPELADMIQTQDFKDQFAQFVTVDTSKFQLAADVKATASTSCDFSKILTTLEVGATQTVTVTDTRTDTRTEVAEDTSPETVTVTADSSGGGSDSKVWIGKGFAIAAALIGVIFAGYNYNLARKSYNLNKEMLAWVEKTYLGGRIPASYEGAVTKWGDNVMTSKNRKLLSPELSSFREKTLIQKNYESGSGSGSKSLLKKDTFKSIRKNVEKATKASVQNAKIATIAGVLVLLVTAVLSSVFQLTQEESKLDALARELHKKN